MNNSALSRSLLLRLFILLLSVSAVEAQSLSDNTEKNDGARQPKITFEQTADTAGSDGKFSQPAPQNKKSIFDVSAPENFENRKKSDSFTPKQSASGSKDKEWGFYAGSFTFHKDLRGESQKAPVFITGIRHAWSLKNNEKRRLRYYVDFNPLIIVNYRQKKLVQASPEVFEGDRKTVFGVGFTPFGLQHNWRNTKKYQPFIAGGIGVAIFNKKFPDNRSVLKPDALGNRFQLMPEFGAGLEIRKSESKSYFIGYKYHHMSNAYTAPINVGYNTNMIYGGLYIMR